ncbi:hypothetical protein SRHO_G00012210 [Serrasalmus rhombeus]
MKVIGTPEFNDLDGNRVVVVITPRRAYKPRELTSPLCSFEERDNDGRQAGGDDYKVRQASSVCLVSGLWISSSVLHDSCATPPVG